MQKESKRRLWWLVTAVVWLLAISSPYLDISDPF